MVYGAFRNSIIGMQGKAHGALKVIGADANFAAVRRTEPFGRAIGTANLDSDPNNLHEDSEHRRMLRVRSRSRRHAPENRIYGRPGYWALRSVSTTGVFSTDRKPHQPAASASAAPARLPKTGTVHEPVQLKSNT